MRRGFFVVRLMWFVSRDYEIGSLTHRAMGFITANAKRSTTNVIF